MPAEEEEGNAEGKREKSPGCGTFRLVLAQRSLSGISGCTIAAGGVVERTQLTCGAVVDGSVLGTVLNTPLTRVGETAPRGLLFMWNPRFIIRQKRGL